MYFGAPTMTRHLHHLVEAYNNKKLWGLLNNFWAIVVLLPQWTKECKNFFPIAFFLSRGS